MDAAVTWGCFHEQRGPNLIPVILNTELPKPDLAWNGIWSLSLVKLLLFINKEANGLSMLHLLWVSNWSAQCSLSSGSSPDMLHGSWSKQPSQEPKPNQMSSLEKYLFLDWNPGDLPAKLKSIRFRVMKLLLIFLLIIWKFSSCTKKKEREMELQQFWVKKL